MLACAIGLLAALHVGALLVARQRMDLSDIVLAHAPFLFVAGIIIAVAVL